MSCPFQIAFCCNGTILPGLHATLRSLVRNLSRREQVSIALFVEHITDAEQEELRGTVADAGGVARFRCLRADISSFKTLNPLHGQGIAYFRLLLPSLLADASRILYFDSDLVINTDACAFFDHPIDPFPIGAIDGGTVEWFLDHVFLKSVGLANDDHAFNSGVLLFNADLWRREGLVERCLQFARAHEKELTSHDQSVLNALFARNFYKLPDAYNTQIDPVGPPLPKIDAVYHFVGSPKPWDPLGRIFHRNWNIWHDQIVQTRFRWSGFLAHHGLAYLDRAWRLRRSYARTWMRRR